MSSFAVSSLSVTHSNPPAPQVGFITRWKNYTLEYLRSAAGVKNFAKLIYMPLTWAGKISPLSGRMKQLSGVGEDAKNFVSAFEFPGLANSFASNLSKAAAKPSLGTTTEAVFSGMQLTSPINDATTLLQKAGVINLKDTTLQTMKKGGLLSLGLGTGRSTVQSLFKSKEKYDDYVQAQGSADKNTKFHVLVNEGLNLGTMASYCALGTLGFVNAIKLLPVAGWVTLASNTSALVCTLLKYYHGRFNNIPQKF